MQNKRIFAGRFFELFTLPGSLRLNTQRGSAQGMRAFKEEERSVLIQFLWHKWKELQGTKLCHLLASSSVCKWRVHSDLKERFLSFVCLFIIIFLPSAFIVFFLLLFFYPHFPIHVRHLQVSGPRLIDTPSLWKPSLVKKVIPSIPKFSELFIFSPANS